LTHSTTRSSYFYNLTGFYKREGIIFPVKNYQGKDILRMRFTIFTRLVVGYLAIFFLIIIVNIYATVQFQKLEDSTDSILNIDNKMLSYNKKLIDTVLSQVQYERKFLIIKDNAFYDSFNAAERDFEQNFKILVSIAESPQARQLLDDVNQSHQLYQMLFYKEVEILRAGQPYSKEWYAQEKEKAVNGIMENMKELRALSESNTYEKIKKLGDAGANARKVAVVMTVFSLIFGIAISIFITRSITKPLAAMRNKSREIARGNYEGNLNLSSSPEINELAQDFNFMCNKLKEMDRMKSDFFALMSHELRTPLTSIKEGITLLLDGIGGETNAKQKRLLSIITEESNRLIGLVNSILDLSKMEAGMMPYNFVKADITPLIKKAVVEIEPIAKTKNIKTELKIIGGRLLITKMDKEKILQVLRNLLGNAVKFTPQGSRVTISAKHVNGNIAVSVADKGPGIAKKDLTSIFDKFRSSKSYKGTGLGLAIVKIIITAHGGKVWAESKPGQGSTFTFMLPA
jgi:two-component system sensor histidine kinase GlrK